MSAMHDVKKVFKEIRTEMRDTVSKPLNKAARDAVKNAVKEVTKDFNITQKELRKRISIKNATTRNPVVEVTLSRKPIALAKFGAKQLKKGVKASVKKGNRKLYEKTFLAKMKSGHIGVFKRKGKEKLPIKEYFGLSSGGSELITSEVGMENLRKAFYKSYDKYFKEALRKISK